MNLLFWKKKPLTEETSSQSADQEVSSKAGEKKPPTEEDGDYATAMARLRTKKLLLVGAAISLLLVTIGIATWKMLSHGPTKGAHDAPLHADSAHKPAPPADAEMARQLQALERKNADLTAQVEALKKEKTAPDVTTTPSQPTPTSQNPVTSNTERELVISNKDPKASAQALKRMIEEMNAASGDRPAKPAKATP